MTPPLINTDAIADGDSCAVRIFIINDHATVRDVLKIWISAQPDMKIVGEANTVRLALIGIRAQQPSRSSDLGE